jgi:hypothetical protein
MMRPILGNEDYAHVGISEPPIKNSDFSLNIYPNPNNGSILNIKTNGIENKDNLTISIFNLQGQMIYNSNYKSRIIIDNLNSGIYIIRVTDEGGTININKKLIITDGIR